MHKSILFITSIHLLVGIIFFSYSYKLYATTRVPATQVASIDIKNKTPAMTLQDMQKIFSVKIDIIGSLGDDLISLKVKDVTLEESVRKILQHAHIKNYSIITNKDNNQLTIRTLSSNKRNKNEKNLQNDHNNKSSLKEKTTRSLFIEDPSLKSNKIDDNFNYENMPPAPSSDKSTTNTNKNMLKSNALNEKFDFDSMPPAPRESN